jgi:hypothetical protein
VASERQIAANRRNAQRSTGPRTKVGKQRSSGNAYRHGLRSRPMPSPAYTQQIEELACEIAGGSKSPIVLKWARTAAEAAIELDRIRRTKLVLIEQVARLGDLPAPVRLSSVKEIRLLRRWLKGREWDGPAVLLPLTAHRVVPVSDADPNRAAPMPPREPDRTAEAVRRLLPQLEVLARYERRAWWRREQALRGLHNSSRMDG